MAKAGKISRLVKTEFGNAESKRPFGQLPPRRYYLIVCEGQETEPNYFRALCRELPKEMAQLITITGEGRNTLSLLEKAEQYVEERRKTNLPPYYHIWLVFDRDSFEPSDFDNTIKSIEKKYKKTERWHSAWSNEAFELWYVLHFQKATGGSLARSQYGAILNEKLHIEYKKNDNDMFERLKPYMCDAIKNAEQALKKQKAENKPYHEQNPATTVHLLIKDLLAYIPKVEPQKSGGGVQ